jgi:hypothetical protein
MTDDLWAIASEDHDSFAREAAIARADAEMEQVFPFLLAARTPEEFAHRSSLMSQQFEAIAARNGIEYDDLAATARRRYELYREALTEGTDPVISLEPLLNGGGYGQGPEKPDEHDEGPDFSGGYSEVPMGAPGGPSPQVTQVRADTPGAVTQAAGSLRRRADANPESMMMSPYMPPDVGTGDGSVDMGLPSSGSGGLTPSIPAGTQGGGGVAPVGQPTSRPGVSSTASRDPVHARVLRVTAMIAEANPGLPASECERLGRKVVSRYLRRADLTDSVMGNGPMTDSGSSGSSSGGAGPAAKALEWQGARSLMKGMSGGGEAAGAGEAAAGAGELAELAPLIAL